MNSDLLGLESPIDWSLPSRPGNDKITQAIFNGITGFGDGTYNSVTFGIGELQDIRDLIGIHGGVDKDSTAYCSLYKAGNVIGFFAGPGSVGKQMLDIAKTEPGKAMIVATLLRLLAKATPNTPPGLPGYPSKPNIPTQNGSPVPTVVY